MTKSSQKNEGVYENNPNLDELFKQSFYQNKDILDHANEMTDKQMNDLLIELSDTAFWTAIIRFVGKESNVSRDGLSVLDPFKEPTKMAREQGKLIGIWSLQRHIWMLIESIKSKKSEEGK